VVARTPRRALIDTGGEREREANAMPTPSEVSGQCRAWPEDSAFIREVLDRIGDKWTMLVVGTLGAGPLRYSDVQARIPGISQRMLAQTLKYLERDGLITRTAYPEVPPRVEYELTDLGRSLLGAVTAMAGWAAAHHGEIARHRAASQRTGVGRRRAPVAASAG
jgi:DNA-binding HxlR family transcriptional regulator